ncbi:MAG TPA: cytochrome-c oxidase, cbb3-type subunit III [Pseudomonadales bacterium]|nr:cytochrome-c oxidase, cbb3-type subunit III [Pseudomonadales bacterium]
MSTFWSLFIIAGTLGSLVWTLWLLLSNRTQPKQMVETTGHDFDGIEEYDNPLPMWWVGLFVATVVFALGYLLYYPGLGTFAGFGKWTSHAQWDRDVQAQNAQFAPLYQRLASLSENELHQSAEAQQIGRRLFLNNCASCHGMRARGGYGFPNLTDGEWQWAGGYDAIKTTIHDGRTAAMPAWGPALGDAGTSDMAQYVLSLSGAEHDAAAAARAAPQFQTMCVACHGTDGKGNPALGAPDLSNDVFLYGSDADTIAFTIRHGRTGTMPNFATTLGDDRIAILAAYVSSLQP